MRAILRQKTGLCFPAIRSYAQQYIFLGSGFLARFARSPYPTSLLNAKIFRGAIISTASVGAQKSNVFGAASGFTNPTS